MEEVMGRKDCHRERFSNRLEGEVVEKYAVFVDGLRGNERVVEIRTIGQGVENVATDQQTRCSNGRTEQRILRDDKLEPCAALLCKLRQQRHHQWGHGGPG